MKKFTLFIASLFLAVGAMAQTFVAPVTGGQYKIKGDHNSLCWLTSEIDPTSKAIKVSANEDDAAVFERTSTGFRVVSTGEYLGMNGSVISYVGAEAAVTVHNTGSQYNADGKYAIKVVNNWLYNNSTEANPVTHESEGWINNIERFWGFVEVETGDGKIVADGVYTIDNKYDGRGSMAYGDWYPGYNFWEKEEYFGLTDITLSGCTGNNLDVDPVSNKYWYVKTTDKGVYIYNIGKGYFLQEYAGQKVTCSTEIANGFTLVKRTANNTNYVSVKSGNYYLSYSCGWAPNSDDGSVRWLTDDEAAATLMTFTPVANAATNYANEIAAANAKINAFEVDNEEAKAALAEKIAQAEALLATITIGERVGEYSCGGYTHAEIESYLGSARNFYESIDAETSVEAIEAYIEFINGTMELCALNMPKNGEYFRVAYDYGGTVGKLYLQGLDSEQKKNNQLSFPAKFAAESGAESIWYYYDGALYSYTAGKCLNETGNNRGLYNVGEKVDATFSASTRAAGKYNIACSSYVHANVTGNNYYTDHCSANNCNQHDFILEAVTELPVSITSAGYATFFAPVAVTVPSGVTAHTVTINGEWATLSEPLSVIPANTGVVLVGEGSHDFAITTANAFEGDNALRGTAAATYITEDAYVLGYINVAEEGQPEKKEVGFYTATKNQQDGASWKNNSHKAYLPMSNANGAVSYSFRFPGTTVIENVEVENTVKAIYDLTGRKVDEITAPGIYIVNGKKVLVK